MSARERLATARLYLCTDARTGPDELLALVRAAVDGGVDVVQLRDRSLTTAQELRLLEQVRTVCHAAGALLAVNDRADLAAAVGADVLHVGQEDLPPAVGRTLLGSDVVVGRSSRGGEQAEAADADPDVDYFCVGPVWETPTKPGRPAVGLGRIRETAAAGHATPWFAIGGIDEQRLPQVLDAGATRIVVVRAITEAGDPGAAARALRRLLPA